MNFHLTHQCRLIPMKHRGSAIVRYDIMSGDEFVGNVMFSSYLGEWIIHLSPPIGVTHGFLAKIWGCLLLEHGIQIGKDSSNV